MYRYIVPVWSSMMMKHSRSFRLFLLLLKVEFFPFLCPFLCLLHPIFHIPLFFYGFMMEWPNKISGASSCCPKFSVHSLHKKVCQVVCRTTTKQHLRIYRAPPSNPFEGSYLRPGLRIGMPIRSRHVLGFYGLSRKSRVPFNEKSKWSTSNVFSHPEE